MKDGLPLVAIVGRVNVGKSTLFNRMIRKPLSVVDRTPGVTRDALIKPVQAGGKRFLLADTGGFPGEEDALFAEVRRHIERTVAEADLVLLVVDGREGPTPFDRELAQWLRREGKRFWVLVNKVDVKGVVPEEFWELAPEEIFPVSGAHGWGVGELVERLARELGAEEAGPKTQMRVAILGKPNTGKSTLLNALVGSPEAAVSPSPGTTRDPVERWKDGVLFVDTAGIKRRFRDSLEYYSYLRSVRSLRFAELAVVLLDPERLIERIDKKIINMVINEARGLVIAVNKADLISDDQRDAVLGRVEAMLPEAHFAPKLLISAKRGEGLEMLMATLERVRREMERKLSPSQIAGFLWELTREHTPPVPIHFMRQISTSPPVFLLGAGGRVPGNYQVFVKKKLYEKFGFVGVPLVLKVKVMRG